jgi:hypothetical protein
MSKKQRRTQTEMQYAWDEAYYFLIQNNNDPQKAYNAMIKDYLVRGKPIPYYIKGIKDFIKVSNDIKQAQIIKQQQEEEKENIEIKLRQISINQWYKYWDKYKSHSNKDIRIALVNFRHALEDNDFKMIDNQDIFWLKTIGIIQ